jgi:hypothetical protein
MLQYSGEIVLALQGSSPSSPILKWHQQKTQIL